MKKPFVGKPVSYAAWRSPKTQLIRSEPAERSWDGWSRINTDTHKGGIVAVFCQGSPDRSHTVTVAGLMPKNKYEILEAPLGKKVGTLNGKELAEAGFKVQVEKAYQGKVFEIRGSSN